MYCFQPGAARTPQQPLTILAIDTDGVEGDAESRMLGTDFMFITAFLGILKLIFFITTINLN